MYSYLLLGVGVLTSPREVIKRAERSSRRRPSDIREDSFHGF